MKDEVEDLLNKYIRKPIESFSVSDVQKYLLKYHKVVSSTEISEYLSSDPYVFYDIKGFYHTRASIFTGKYFSFVPTNIEVDNKYLIIGHRALPFVDPDFLPSDLHLFYEGELLPTKVENVLTKNVVSLYSLFGEEYVTQIIGFDPANSDIDLADTDYLLPSKIHLTVVDVKEIFDSYNFKYGDRIVALVSDWDKGCINIVPLCNNKKSPFEETSVDRKRLQWEKELETALKYSIENKGPCFTIDEQLVYTYLHSINKLSVPYCGSVSEFLQKTRNFSIREYGVETRLWFSDSEIPATGKWSSESITNSKGDKNKNNSKEKKYQDIFDKIGFFIPDTVVRLYVLDSLFKKEKDLFALVTRILPENIIITEVEYNAVLLHLEKKRAIIRKGYNWFADYNVAQVRSNCLDLYSKLMTLCVEIENTLVDTSVLTQYNLITLTQLTLHIVRMLISLDYPNEIEEKDLSTISITIEGMYASFEDTSMQIIAELDNYKKKI